MKKKMKTKSVKFVPPSAVTLVAYVDGSFVATVTVEAGIFSSIMKSFAFLKGN